MAGNTAIQLLIVFVLTLANSVFAAAEISIVSARRSRLQQQIDLGNKRAGQALGLAEHPDRFLATVQIGITLIQTISAAFGGAEISGSVSDWLKVQFPAIAGYTPTIAFVTVVILITYVELVIGELVPKRLGLQFAETIAMSTAPIMDGLATFAQPVVFFLTGSVNVVLRLLRQPPSKQLTVTEEDIVYLAHEGIASGSVEAAEEEMIRRIFRFTDRVVRNVMTPRTEIAGIEVDTPLKEVTEIFMDSGYSRLPVYQNDLDNIVGILYAKDLIRTLQVEQPPRLQDLLHPPFFIPEYQHVDDLMSIFRREGTHLAMVIDEYGQIVGLVTLEDILEELVGEIQDEFDVEEEKSIVRRDDGSWLVDAMEPYEKISEQVGLPPIPSEEQGEYQTLAGLILTRLGRIPTEGDKIDMDGFSLEVMDMDGRRIDKVLITQQSSEQAV